MSKKEISCSINKQLKNAIVSLLSSSSSSPLLSTTKSSVKRPNFLLNFCKTLTPKKGLLFSHSRVINYSSNSNPHVFSLLLRHTGKLGSLVAHTTSKERTFGYQFQLGFISCSTANLIPHTSGMINYALLMFGNVNSQTPRRDSEAKSIGSSHSYMIIERHASGSLPEMTNGGVSSQSYHISKIRLNSKPYLFDFLAHEYHQLLSISSLDWKLSE
ncbi:hypothetical protein MKW92_002835 [Papaver armeniacum]|nr:hypothetical protein MKW92_002835 [Papaver armeniacum]